MPDFEWTGKREQAAELIAKGDLTTVEIAEFLDIDRKTLWNWRKDAEFQARVASIVEEFRVETLQLGVAIKERRISKALNRHKRLSRILENKGDTFDRHLYKSILELEKQLAQELDQWTENAAVNVTGLDAAGKPDEAQALLAAARQLRANAKRSGDGPEHEADRG